jgi:hypothetical protein
MFPTYRAVLENGSVEWLGSAPDAPYPVTVLITVVGEDAPDRDAIPPRLFRYRLHLHGPTYGVGPFLDSCMAADGFVSAVPDITEETIVVTLTLDRPPPWQSWTQMVAPHGLDLTGIEKIPVADPAA